MTKHRAEIPRWLTAYPGGEHVDTPRPGIGESHRPLGEVRPNLRVEAFFLVDDEELDRAMQLHVEAPLHALERILSKRAEPLDVQSLQRRPAKRDAPRASLQCKQGRQLQPDEAEKEQEQRGNAG
jgi:hypothetical protein